MSTTSPLTRPSLPEYRRAELPPYRKKRAAAHKALQVLDLPSDKKYTNWERLQLAGKFEGKDIGGVDPVFSIDQADYETGIKTIAIPLAKAVKDWPEHVTPYLQKALPETFHYYSALSAAYYRTGAVVVVPPDTEAHIVADYSLEAGKLNAYRTIVVVGAGARATFTEKTSGALLASETLLAHGVEVYVNANAKFDYYALQQWPAGVTSFSAYRALLERDSAMDWLIGSFGASLSHLHVESGLNGEGAESNVRAVYYGNNDQHFDQQLVASHLVGHTTSDTYARGIVDDTARAVYRGMIQIHPGAHGSSADQNGHAMLLKNTARVDSIPGLEIDADDVTAGHGATIGEVDEEQLFYLMARGIAEHEARDLIIHGFFEDLFKRVSRKEVREQFWSAVRAKQQERLGAHS